MRYVRAGRTYAPDPKAHAAYEQYQAVYDALYDSTKELAHKLSSFVRG
jgi:sugar (pentulose or hexulose) kinase